jgi:cell division protein FtsW
VQKLHFLPEPHTDFVFAVLTEEFGLVGATLVIGLFAVLVYRAFDLGRRTFKANLPFHGLLSFGIGISLGLQAAINIGVNTGLLPTKGLTLPLISYGRTSVVVTLFALGLLFRIGRELDDVDLPKRARSSR